VENDDLAFFLFPFQQENQFSLGHKEIRRRQFRFFRCCGRICWLPFFCSLANGIFLTDLYRGKPGLASGPINVSAQSVVKRSGRIRWSHTGQFGSRSSLQQ
jgi:hypothetical protein